MRYSLSVLGREFIFWAGTVFLYWGAAVLFLFLFFSADPAEVSLYMLIVISITGFYFGRLSRKFDLFDSFALRYWPLLTPVVLLLAGRIFYNALGGSVPNKDVDYLIIMFSLGYAPLIFAFAVLTPSEKKLVSTRWRCQTGAFVAALFAILWWQTSFDDTLERRYTVDTVGDEVIVRQYRPWPWDGENNALVRLDVPASLLLSADYPALDGATSFVPIYSAVANAVYQGDRDSLVRYVRFSRTGTAYDRLIRGEADLIFVLQPSDGHLAAAKDAKVELRLTPIAKEAFVFFVNRRNPVSDLSIEQIQSIYLKKVTNWREVGGSDKKILAFQRPENSGSQTAMIKSVMKDKTLPPPLQAEYSAFMGSMYRDVAIYRDREESIGYSFRFFTQEMMQYRDGQHSSERYRPAPDAEPVKLLSVNGVAPTAENIRNGSYPFTEDVFAVTAGTSNPHVPELINWLLSPQGQELIEKTGYVGLR